MSAVRATGTVLVFLGSLFALPACADFASAFPTPAEAAQANERTVGVLFERDELVFDLMEDIEESLNLAAGLRIVPIVGRNHVQSVYDLLYLDGVDLALVRSDSIEYVHRAGGSAGARHVIRDVAKIGNEKIVVVAHEAYTRADELESRPVAFGRSGSGEFVTGTLVFDALGIEVLKVEADGEEALERVRSGELAAMVHLLDAPGAFPAGADVRPDGRADGRANGSTDGANVLALPRDDALSALYRSATLDATDLPGLIAGGESVPTYSVDVNLVAYAWDADDERARRMARFVEALVDRLEALQGDAFEPEWQAVSLETETPNIDSSPMVEQALARRAATKARVREARRLLERMPEAETRAARPQLLVVKDDEVVVRLGGEPGEDAESGFERPFDELDALLAIPDGRPRPADANGSFGEETKGPVRAVAEPAPDGLDG